ncbi:MAG: hypothetical protein ACXABG_11700 [Promethearchaeota archaeon]|jgi:hypothetical protein
MPCYFLKTKIKNLLEELRDITQFEIENELLKEYSDEELHEMSEDMLYVLILAIYEKLKKKKMRKEAKLIYI